MGACEREDLMDCPCQYCGICEPIDAHIALSLYQFNVGPGERAQKILHHFDSECAPMHVLMELVDNKNWATEMAMPTAGMYLVHATDKYIVEARTRVDMNLGL